jgi:hypothetical protein
MPSGLLIERFGRHINAEVNVPNGAIIEKEAQSVLPEDSHAHNCWKVRHGNILGKGQDREKTLRPTSAFPVCQQLVSVEPCLLANETESSWLMAPGQDDAIHRDGGPVAGVMSVEMGYRMVGLIPIM